MRLKKVGDWIEYRTEMGQVFFYNETTGDFQWIDPNNQNHTSRNRNNQNEYTNDDYENNIYNDETTSMTASVDRRTETEDTANQMYDHSNDDVTQSIDPELQHWRAYRDPSTGAIFWYNSVTNLSQWECPGSVATTDCNSNNYYHNDNYDNYNNTYIGNYEHSDITAAAAAAAVATGAYMEGQSDISNTFGMEEELPPKRKKKKKDRSGKSRSRRRGSANEGVEQDVVEVLHNDDLGI